MYGFCFSFAADLYEKCSSKVACTNLSQSVTCAQSVMFVTLRHEMIDIFFFKWKILNYKKYTFIHFSFFELKYFFFLLEQVKWLFELNFLHEKKKKNLVTTLIVMWIRELIYSKEIKWNYRKKKNATNFQLITLFVA